MRSTPQTPAESTAAVADAMENVIALTICHRTKLEAEGFSPTMAEHMASEFHTFLLNSILGAQKK